jgi:hypothetical protein
LKAHLLVFPGSCFPPHAFLRKCVDYDFYHQHNLAQWLFTVELVYLFGLFSFGNTVGRTSDHLDACVGGPRRHRNGPTLPLVRMAQHCHLSERHLALLN